MRIGPAGTYSDPTGPVRVMLGTKVLSTCGSNRAASAFAQGFNAGCSQVFLLWDNTPQEKGEASELVDAFVTFESAEAHAKTLAEDIDPDTDWAEMFSIERREPKF